MRKMLRHDVISVVILVVTICLIWWGSHSLIEHTKLSEINKNEYNDIREYNKKYSNFRKFNLLLSSAAQDGVINRQELYEIEEWIKGHEHRKRSKEISEWRNKP